MLYRIYTETRPGIPGLVSLYFDSFTLIPSKGYWRGVEEDSTIIEVFTSERAKVLEMVKTIKEVNQQEAVLVQTISIESGVLV